MQRSKVLDIRHINKFVKQMEFSLRARLVDQARLMEQNVTTNKKKTISKITCENIGDASAAGQRPITLVRQVVVMCVLPSLLETEGFPEDAKDRVRRIRNECGGQSVGCYTDYRGLEVVRRDVAKYITERDGGIPSDHDNIFLSTGASDAIEAVLLTVIRSAEPRTGVMLAVPTHPLFAAFIAECNGYVIPYQLDEDNDWALNIDTLQQSLAEARPHCDPKALVIINPANPTGTVLSRSKMEEIIKFAKKERLVILADEVYQHNVYGECEFHSFKKVMSMMGPEYASMELVSFMSVSKGFTGECGYRSGYCEMTNLDAEVKAALLRLLSPMGCAPVTGQVALDVLVNPPVPGEPSYDLFTQERDQILKDLSHKAGMVADTLNAVDGMHCTRIMGATYAFPRIYLPQKAIQKAKVLGQTPDALYCTELLEQTGICVLPGSAFGQKEGTYHFRMTILASVDQLKTLLRSLVAFHLRFLAAYK